MRYARRLASGVRQTTTTAATAAAATASQVEGGIADSIPSCAAGGRHACETFAPVRQPGQMPVAPGKVMSQCGSCSSPRCGPARATPTSACSSSTSRASCARLGHEVQVSAIDRRGGRPVKYARLSGASVVAARRFRPDVVFAHFLFPAGAAGAAAAVAARVPLVVMAHGTDVENARRSRGAGARDAAGHEPRGDGDLQLALAGRPPRPGPRRRARSSTAASISRSSRRGRRGRRARAVGWGGDGPAFLAVGSLIERKGGRRARRRVRGARARQPRVRRRRAAALAP